MQLYGILAIFTTLILEVLSTSSSLYGQVHVFYYLWYGSPTTDGEYKHWNHEVLPHWETRINHKYKDKIGKRFNPPAEIHAAYYPQLGPYSSVDEQVLQMHFRLMAEAGVDVAVVSWWGLPSR